MSKVRRACDCLWCIVDLHSHKLKCFYAIFWPAEQDKDDEGGQILGGLRSVINASLFIFFFFLIGMAKCHCFWKLERLGLLPSAA